MLINSAESYYNKIYVWSTTCWKNPEIARLGGEESGELLQRPHMILTRAQVLPGAQQMLTTITGGIWTGILGPCDLHHQLPGGRRVISVCLLAMKGEEVWRCLRLLYATPAGAGPLGGTGRPQDESDLQRLRPARCAELPHHRHSVLHRLLRLLTALRAAGKRWWWASAMILLPGRSWAAQYRVPS